MQRPIAILLAVVCAVALTACGEMVTTGVPVRRLATADTAREQMSELGGATDFYMIENKSLPKSLEVLTQPSPKSGEPYITKIPVDPWGEPYVYKVVNAAKREYEITSSGEDEVLGTADDIRFP